MKKFKKTIACVLTVIMVLATAATAFAIAIIDEDGNIVQENEVLEGGIVPMMGEIGDDMFLLAFPDFGHVTGEVVEFWENEFAGQRFVRIRVDFYGELAGYYTHADFSIDMNTFILGEEPEIGDIITGFFDNNRPIIMIYPPQYTALAIVNSDEVVRVILERFNDEWVSSAEQFRLNIGEDTDIVFQGGDAFEGEIEELIGRKLLVEFAISHRDIPETIPNPTRITILYERAVHPTLEIDWDWETDHSDFLFYYDIWANINWEGHAYDEIDWSAYSIIITLHGTSKGVPNAAPLIMEDDENFQVFVPLRAVAEMLGFSLGWNSGTRQITVDSPRGTISFVAESPYYYISTPGGIGLATQGAPSVVLNGRTYMSLSFFRDIYGFVNAFFSGGEVHLDNNPWME